MAIDAGTGSCRAVIFDSMGNQLSFSQREWAHKQLKGFPSSQVFDTTNNWRLISECVRESIRSAELDPHAVKAVSSTSMREGMVLYDEAGKEIWACPNVDSRAASEARYLIKTGKARRIFSLAGDWISITAPARFLWIRKHEPNVFREIKHIGMLSDWILYRLSGEFVTDPSAGSSSGMFDLKSRDWSKEIMGICDLESHIFPKVTQPGTIVGKVTRKASLETGLLEETPVVVGGADTQLGLVGLGVTKPGQVTLLGGSFWQLTMLLDKAVIDPKIRLRTLCHAVQNEWMIEGIGFYCGLTMRWFRDAFCELEKQEAKRKGVDPYTLIEKEASVVPPGANGVFGIFSNIMNSKRWAHASPAFMQFDITDPAHSGKKECIRAIEEAAAFVVMGHLNILQSLSRGKVREITFAGGGAKGYLWPQIISDVLNVKVRTPVVKESTSHGAAICAGIGAGLYNDLETAGREFVRFEDTFEPKRANHEKYVSLYEKWLRLYGEVMKISDAGLLNPLWKAAGA